MKAGDIPDDAVLRCPCCDVWEYASEEDPDAGLDQMYRHILRDHAEYDPTAAKRLLADVRLEAAP